MAENLNYEYIPENDEDSGESWCYWNSEEYCDKYGRLYNWAAANEVCPEGWHLPSNEDWDALLRPMATNVEDFGDAWRYKNVGVKLKSTFDWKEEKGDDLYGFSILPAGFYDDAEDICYNTYLVAYFWSSVEYYKGNAYAMYLTKNDQDARLQYNAVNVCDDQNNCEKKKTVPEVNKSFAYSVRCLKDAGK